MAIASWDPGGDTGFTVGWSTGFVGYTMTVARSGDSLLGTNPVDTTQPWLLGNNLVVTIQPWSDDRPDGWWPELTGEIRMIACKLPSKTKRKAHSHSPR